MLRSKKDSGLRAVFVWKNAGKTKNNIVVSEERFFNRDEQPYAWTVADVILNTHKRLVRTQDRFAALLIKQVLNL